MLRYAYYALRYGERRARLELVKANVLVPGSHVAVWLGASSPDAQSWIQAGIEMEYGDEHPFAYIETGRGSRQTSISRSPFALGVPLVVRLRVDGRQWRVKAGTGEWSQPVALVGGQRIRTLEALGPVHAVARLDGKTVRV